MMEIAGLSLGIYVVVLLASIFIGFITNKTEVMGNKILNIIILTMYWLIRDLFNTFQLRENPWVAWLFHPVAIVVVVGYAIGTFVEDIWTLAVGG